MWSNCRQTQRPPSVISYLWLCCRRNETWTPAERRQTRHVSSAETARFQPRLLGEREVGMGPPDRTGPLLNNSDNRRHHRRRGLMRINTALWGSNVAKISRPLGAGLNMTDSKAPGPPPRISRRGPRGGNVGSNQLLSRASRSQQGGKDWRGYFRSKATFIVLL